MKQTTFRNTLPNLYYCGLSNRQWRLIVSALSEMKNNEANSLASDLLHYVLPPTDS
jgi:hypothetical protein